MRRSAQLLMLVLTFCLAAPAAFAWTPTKEKLNDRRHNVMDRREAKCLHTWRPKPIREIPLERYKGAWLWWGGVKEKTAQQDSRCLPSSPVALGKYLAAKRYGWVGSQWNALYNLWNRESGWDPYKWNSAGSGACGIPQFLPCRYYGQAYAQIVAGLDYIRARYQTPERAWAHSNAYNWY